MHARLAALQERKKQLVGLPLWALLSLDGPSYKQSSSSSLQQALAAQTKSSEADGAKDDVTITGVSTTSHTPCGTVSKFSAPAGKLQKRAAHVPKIEKVTPLSIPIMYRLQILISVAELVTSASDHSRRIRLEDCDRRATSLPQQND